MNRIRFCSAVSLLCLILFFSLALATPAIPPTVVITSHSNGQFVVEESIRLEGTVSGPDGVSRVDVLWPDGVWRSATLSGNIWYEDMDLYFGANVIQVKAKDVYGNWSTPVSVTINYLAAPGYVYMTASDGDF